MKLHPIFERLVEKSPTSAMSPGVIEHVLDPEPLKERLDKKAENQYTQELSFSSIAGNLKNERIVCKFFAISFVYLLSSSQYL